MQEASEVADRARADARPTWTAGRCAATSSRSRPPTRAACRRRSSPVTVKSKKGDTVVEVDEAPRRETSLEALAKLPPQFVKDGSHTAGNAPGVNDGAGALVLASDEWAKQQRPHGAGDDRRAAREVADDFAYLARTPAKAAQAGAREGRAEGRATSTCGRSTRRSPRSRSTRSACSASTRTR